MLKAAERREPWEPGEAGPHLLGMIRKHEPGRASRASCSSLQTRSRTECSWFSDSLLQPQGPPPHPAPHPHILSLQGFLAPLLLQKTEFSNKPDFPTTRALSLILELNLKRKLNSTSFIISAHTSVVSHEKTCKSLDRYLTLNP